MVQLCIYMHYTYVYYAHARKQQRRMVGGAQTMKNPPNLQVCNLRLRIIGMWFFGDCFMSKRDGYFIFVLLRKLKYF